MCMLISCYKVNKVTLPDNNHPCRGIELCQIPLKILQGQHKPLSHSETNYSLDFYRITFLLFYFIFLSLKCTFLDTIIQLHSFITSLWNSQIEIRITESYTYHLLYNVCMFLFSIISSLKNIRDNKIGTSYYNLCTCSHSTDRK